MVVQISLMSTYLLYKGLDPFTSKGVGIRILQVKEIKLRNNVANIIPS